MLAFGMLGFVLVAFTVLAPWIISRYDYAVFIPAMAASGLLALAATMLAPAVPTRGGLLLVLMLGAIMRLIVLADPPLLSTDIYRYIWDGRVQGAGISPYLHVPADPALNALRDAAIYPNINRAGYAVTAYPPVAQMVFWAVTRASETVLAMRLAMVACEAVVIAVMIDLLRRLSLSPVAVVAWVWHPLSVWEIAGSGHVDALMLALLMIGLRLLVLSRRVAGAAFVALAVLVKPYAVLALPAFWRPWDWRAPLAAVAVAVLCYLPYVAGAGSNVLGYATAGGYFAEEGFTSGSGLWLVGVLQAVLGDLPVILLVYAFAAVATLAWVTWHAVSREGASAEASLTDVAALLMAGLFFLSPNYAWYVLAVVPFTVLGGPYRALAWAMSLGAILLYRPMMLPAHDLAWKTLAILPFLVVLAVTTLRSRLPMHFRRAQPWTR